MRKKWITGPVLAVFFLLLLSLRVTACAEEEPIQQPGLPAALERARTFNTWVEQHTPEEIAIAEQLPLENILSPTGTDALPEPLITVRQNEDWQSLVGRVLDKYGVTEDNVGIGYYNSRTGDECYINADRYLISASMFKIPLNMIFADRISSGEMALDTPIGAMPYNWYQYRTIVHSDNDRSVVLMEQLGGYHVFKQLQILVGDLKRS